MNYELSAINLKKLLPYIGIFFVLLMGSGAVQLEIYNYKLEIAENLSFNLFNF